MERTRTLVAEFYIFVFLLYSYELVFKMSFIVIFCKGYKLRST